MSDPTPPDLGLPVVRAGRGGTWQIGHADGMVVLAFFAIEDIDRAVFQTELTTDVAIGLAHRLVTHALKAGHREPVTLSLGG